MTTTPESILARFAAEYAEHGANPKYRLRVTYKNGGWCEGYVYDVWMGYVLVTRRGAKPGIRHIPYAIARIDYSNARYRGAQPLWEREG